MSLQYNAEISQSEINCDSREENEAAEISQSEINCDSTEENKAYRQISIRVL